ncbi:MAG: HAD family hydrolase [Spartobacteria bacterium]|nr:HAD family hydrolase [Spartobacteria bacterium]
MTLSLEQRAAQVEAVVFDVDGVLTSGAIIYGVEGELKQFHVQDGHGFKLAKRAGLKLGLITGRASAMVERRAEELGVDFVAQGVKNKGEMLPELFARLGVTGNQVCYVGDDLVDLPVMYQVILPVAVANAVPEVRERAVWTTERRGGDGAAREVIDFVIKAKGLWPKIMEKYSEA